MTILIIFYFGIIITHIFFFFLIYKNLINDQNITLTLTCPHHAMRFKPYFFFYHSPLCSNDIRILSSRIIVIFLTFFNYLFIILFYFIYLFIYLLLLALIQPCNIPYIFPAVFFFTPLVTLRWQPSHVLPTPLHFFFFPFFFLKKI